MTCRCSYCHEEFRGASRPLWVFGANAEPLGIMHAKCSKYRDSHLDVIDVDIATAQEARFEAWARLTVRGDPGGAREMAIIMAWAEHPSLRHNQLSPNQLRWIERYTPERQHEIRTAYNDLLSEFASWLAARNAVTT